MLQCLFAEELFLTPLICQEVEVVFCIVLLEISDVGEHYCSIMQLHRNTARIEGKLSFHQEDPFQFVTSQGDKYAFAYAQCKVELSSPRKESTCTQRSKS